MKIVEYQLTEDGGYGWCYDFLFINTTTEKFFIKKHLISMVVYNKLTKILTIDYYGEEDDD